jgi:hypothetical protein
VAFVAARAWTVRLLMAWRHNRRHEHCDSR